MDAENTASLRHKQHWGFLRI